MKKYEIQLQNVAPLLMCIYRKINKFFSLHLPDKDLNIMQHYIISEIFRFKGPCSSIDIVNSTAIDKGTVSKYIRFLAEKSYVRLTGDDHSRKKITLDEKGIAVAKGVFNVVCDIENKIIIGLNEAELEKHSDFLHVLYRELYNDSEYPGEDSENWPKFLTYVSHLARGMELKGNEHYNSTGMELNQSFILYLLYTSGTELSYKTLERNIETVQSCIATQVRKLEEKGYVVSTVSEGDKRAKNCHLTETGKDLCVEYINYCKRVDERYGPDTELLITALNKICNNLEKMIQEL